MSHVLVVNAGSSSLKLAVFTPTLQLVEKGTSASIAQWLDETGISPSDISAVGHRIVHGGRVYTAPTRLDHHVRPRLQELVSLAPLHMPIGLTMLDDMRKRFPHAIHVACFDTAFHAHQDPLAQRLPLPRAYHDKGYRRYGFHGLNYENVVNVLPLQTGSSLPRRLIVAHLGNGSSMCAIRDGRSIATTMGFSTADGLVMGTRPGSLDPGVLLVLLRDENMSADEIEDLLYRRSGLLGLSGISADMRELLASTEPSAGEAIDHYCYSAARHAGSLAVALGGVDAMVFTGGIGENSEFIRTRIMSYLLWLNIPQVYVVQADEERIIAMHASALIG